MNINGKKVMNAFQKIVLVIKPNDIKNGDSKNPSECAAAQACMRQLHATQARVHIGRTYVEVNDKWLRFRTSDALRSEIIAFDRGGTFEPGTYELLTIPPSDRKPRTKSRKRQVRRAVKKHYHTVTGIKQHGANR